MPIDATHSKLAAADLLDAVWMTVVPVVMRAKAQESKGSGMAEQLRSQDNIPLSSELYVVDNKLYNSAFGWLQNAMPDEVVAKALKAFGPKPDDVGNDWSLSANWLANECRTRTTEVRPDYPFDVINRGQRLPSE